jgi:hypothetical protein
LLYTSTYATTDDGVENRIYRIIVEGLVSIQKTSRVEAMCRVGSLMGIPGDADRCSGHADHRFRDDGDHDSEMMPITRSGMIPIS